MNQVVRLARIPRSETVQRARRKSHTGKTVTLYPLVCISQHRRGDREASSPKRGNGPVTWSGPQAKSMKQASETEGNWRAVVHD